MFQTDTVIRDRYCILHPLGKGGFSQTFEVEDLAATTANRKRVLKVLLEDYPKAVDLFQREAKVLSQLQHPGIPAVEADGYFTWAVTGQDKYIHCLVMERVPGIDLRQWMDDPRYVPIGTARALDWLFQMVDILKKIHQCQCFHRDIKPSNIILRPDGRLALIDFGAVREITETYLHKCADDITHTHVYSRGYTPIEQMQGRAIPASDFFALGRTFVHLMTGCNPLEFPLDSHSSQLIWQHRAPQIIPSLAQLIDRMMAPTAGHRPRTIDKIYEALVEIKQEFETGATTTDVDATADTVLYDYGAEEDPEAPSAHALPHKQLKAPTSGKSGGAASNGTSVSIPYYLASHPSGNGDEPTELPPEYEETGQPSTPLEEAQRYVKRYRKNKQPGRLGRLIRTMGWLTRWPRFTAIAWSGIVISGVTGLRLIGALQGVELQTLDVQMQGRSPEVPDPRLLFITIDESDLEFQNQNNMVRRGSALSDVALYQLLEKLQPHEPSVIGLDIYRVTATESQSTAGESAPPFNATLAQTSPDPSSLVQSLPDQPSPEQLATQGYLIDYDNLFVVCSTHHAIEPPPSMPLTQVGFVDFAVDPDRTIRRQIVGMSPSDRCPTDKSLSYQLAASYLSQQDIPVQLIDGTLYFGDRPIPPLTQHPGGYYGLPMGGYEMMIHYRKSDAIGQRVNLEEILSGRLDDQLDRLVRDQIVLIGTVAPSFRDYHRTPHGDLAGVEIHGHMTSQLISTVLDRRPLIWVWPLWGEVIWMWLWTIASTVWIWRERSPLKRWGGWSLLVITMTGSGHLLFLTGGWIPLVPTVLAMAIAAIGTNGVRYHLKARKAGSDSQSLKSLKTSTPPPSSTQQQ